MVTDGDASDICLMPPLVCSVKCSSTDIEKIFSGVEGLAKEEQQQQQASPSIEDDQDFDSTDRDESIFSTKVI